MKRFFTALCVFCLTAVFASAEEPELIERPLSWTIDSIQIVWTIEEQELEKYEFRAKSDSVKSFGVDNTQLSQKTTKITGDVSAHASLDGEASIGGGFGFSKEFFKNWGLHGSLGLKAGLGGSLNYNQDNVQQNEWVNSVKNTSQVTEFEDASQSSQMLKGDRKLKFTVNFVNHTDEDLIFNQREDDIIPIYCGDKQLGNATPVPVNINKEFVIPHHTDIPKPCQFQMNLDDSGKMKLLESAPDIRILGSQIKIYNGENKNIFNQLIQKFPCYTVRLTADNSSREWEFKYFKKHKYAVHDVFEAINEDCEEEDLFEFNEDGSIRSVAGYKVKLSKKPRAFILFAWNGKPVADLKDLQPRKNSVLDVILVSRALLETRQSDTLTALVPFKETLEKWVKEGRFDGKYLEWNLLTDENQRIAEIKNKTEENDAVVFGNLGSIYHLEGNYKEAFLWYYKSAEEGNVEAQYHLGDCYFNGIGVEKDEKEAARWYRKAAEDGDAWAQCKLGECYQDGIGVEKNEKEAVRWYLKAPELVFSQCSLGYCYQNGIGVEKDEKEAVRWYRKAAEQGNVDAQFNLGLNYEEGIGVEKDEKEAARWYRKAAEQGSATAQFNLGCCYRDGFGVEKDEKEAVRWFSKAAEDGDDVAQFILGNCYLNGTGVEKDEKEAVRWYRMAAEQGIAEAQFNLGCCYIDGFGVEKDEKEAVRWYRKAAEQGSATAQFNLGNCYLNGTGVEKDEKEAVRWFRKAAEQGMAKAQFNLGYCYYNGIGVKKDEMEAVRWFRKAAEQGEVQAQKALRELGY